jgi:hypothetical protein
VNRERLQRALRAGALALLSLFAGGSASAQLIVEAEGTVNLGYARDRVEDAATSRLYAEARPALALQFGSPRLAWRTSYVFSAMRTLQGEGAESYAHAGDVSVAAELGPRSSLTLGAGAAYGRTEFRLSERAPETAAPTLRDLADTTRVSATATQTWAWEASPRVRVGQSLAASVDAPASAFEDRNLLVGGAVHADWGLARDALGATYGARYAVLQPGGEEGPRVEAVTSTLQATWNRDLSERWSGQLSAGVEQVAVLGGPPMEVHPVGGAIVRYHAGRIGGALSYTRGAAASLETGTMSMSDEVLLRGLLSLDPLYERHLSASAGYLRSRPLDATPEAAAGSGEALQGDAALVWELIPALAAEARYSVAYQYGREGAAGTALVQVVVIGLTGRWSNGRAAPMPRPGDRVDGSDGVGFTPTPPPGP